MKKRFRYAFGLTLLQRLKQVWAGQAEHSSQRLLEAVLPVASLYGMDTANIDPEWFREQRTR